MTNTDYWNHVSDAASLAAFNRDEDPDSLVSAETQPENSSVLDFKAFFLEYPEKLLPMLDRLRPEWQELFLEYYVLGRSQSFLAKTHGYVQTRAWQALRMTEQAIGAFIVLGLDPNVETLRPILEKAGVEKTDFGSLATMIWLYSREQSYTKVATTFTAPVPAIRKIFRPVIQQLLTSKDLKAAAVGAYLRNLTHQASLTGSGLSKRYIARLGRLKKIRFDAPAPNPSPLISYGQVSALKDTPWIMLEISSEFRTLKIMPFIEKYEKRLFGKKAAQVFAPLDSNGELKFGYIFARAASSNLPRSLMRIRGISEIAAKYKDGGELIGAVTILDADVQKMIEAESPAGAREVKIGDYVRVLSGEAKGYCGKVRSKTVVDVSFPSGRRFSVDFTPGSVEVLHIPEKQQTFWGPITR